MSRHTAGSLMIAGCGLTWGFIAIVVRELDVPAMAIVFYRVLFAVGAISLVLVVMGRRDLFRIPRPAVLGLGVLLALHWSSYFAAIKETSVASAVLVTYAGPIFMALIAPMLIGERVPGVSIGALAVSVAGIAVITVSGAEGSAAVRLPGIALAVLAALSFALLVVLLKRYAAEVDPVTVVLYEDAVGALVLWPAAVFGEYQLGATEIGYLFLLGAVLTGAAGIVYVAALRWVPATTAGILAYLEPVSAAVLAALLLGETLTAGVVLGGLAIIAAGTAVAARGPEPAAGVTEEPVPVSRG
jgi:drug/metabolite transporter (DMT)-like permease